MKYKHIRAFDIIDFTLSKCFNHSYSRKDKVYEIVNEIVKAIPGLSNGHAFLGIYLRVYPRTFETEDKNILGYLGPELLYLRISEKQIEAHTNWCRSKLNLFMPPDEI